MNVLFIVISSLLALISPIIYAKAIFKGNAKPHRTTRFVLFLITFLSTISLFAQHDEVAIWLAGVSTIQAIVIFILSIKSGIGGWDKKDLICLGIAIIGIILWQTTKNPAIALYASIAADFIGMVPALIKTYHFPKTEIWSFYVLDVFAGIFSLFALQSFTWEHASYPLYIVIINGVMVLLIIRSKISRVIPS